MECSFRNAIDFVWLHLFVNHRDIDLGHHWIVCVPDNLGLGHGCHIAFSFGLLGKACMVLLA